MAPTMLRASMKNAIAALHSDPVLWISRPLSALRTGFACLLVLLVVSHASQFLEFFVFAYVMAITVVGESALGKALEDAASVLKGTLLAVGFSLLVLQITGNVSLRMCLACIFLKSFIFTYPANQQAVKKRIALALTCIIYVNSYTKPLEINTVFFPLKLAATTMLGTLCAIIALIFPLPRFSTYQARYKANCSARMALDGFSVLVDAFCTTDPGKLVQLCLKSKALVKSACKFNSELQKKQVEATWEPKFLNPVAAPCLTKQSTERISNINSCLIGMNMALESGPVADSSALIQSMVRNSLERVRDWSTLFLTGVVTKSPSAEKQVTADEDEGKDALFSLNCTIAAWTGISNMLDEGFRRTFFMSNAQHLVEEEIQLLKDEQNGAVSDSQKEQQTHTPTCDSFVKSLLPQPAKAQESKLAWMKKFFELEIDSKRLLESLKISLALTIAVYLGLLYNEEYGYWSTVTVALGLYNEQSGTFKSTSLRIQGTAIGTIYGYLVVKITHQAVLSSILALVPWLMFTSFMRESKLFGITGASTSFSSAVIILGRKRPGSVQGFTVIRVTQAMLGLATFLIVQALICPRRAAVLARQELGLNLKKIQDCLEGVFALHETTQKCGECFNKSISVLEQKEKKIRAGIARFNALIAEAKAEPDFWYVPFQADIYGKLAASQSRIADLLHFLILSSADFHASNETIVENKLASRIQIPTKAIECDLRGTYDWLHQALQVKGPKSASEVSHRQKTADLEKQLQTRESLVPVSHIDLRFSADCFCRAYEELEPHARNAIVLSFGALAFCLHAVLKESMELEKSVLELLQAESSVS